MNLADKLIKEAFADIKTYHKKPIPNIIYHYTSLNGLIGIIESQSLFASNLYYLNDRKEYQHGIEIILDTIKDLKNEKSNSPVLSEVEKNIELIKQSERYVTCFSSDGDLLSQWRAYGNNGGGISIGFNRENIEDGFFSQFIHSNMILYDEADQKYSIRKQIELILTYFEEKMDFFDWGNFDSDFLIAKVIIDFLEKTISIYKHPSFQDEKEYRLEYELDGYINKQDAEELNFRTSNNLIVPYIRLTSKYNEFLKSKEEKNELNEPIFLIKKLPIAKIILGPSIEFTALKNAVNLLLTKNGYENIPIVESEVPYRI